MNSKELDKEIKIWLNEYNKEKKGSNLHKIENLFESYLKKNPGDLEVWLNFAEFERTYFKDDYKAQDILLEALDHEPNNPYVVLMLGYLAFTISNRFQDESLQLLDQLKSNDPEILSMIEYTTALYYFEKNREKYKECLQKSVKYYDKQVRNNYDLGLLLGKKSKEGQKLIKNALDNVKLIYIYFPSMKKKSKLYTIDDFLNYFIKGTHLTYPVYDSMKESLEIK